MRSVSSDRSPGSGMAVRSVRSSVCDVDGASASRRARGTTWLRCRLSASEGASIFNIIVTRGGHSLPTRQSSYTAQATQAAAHRHTAQADRTTDQCAEHVQIHVHENHARRVPRERRRIRSQHLDASRRSPPQSAALTRCTESRNRRGVRPFRTLSRS